MSPRLPEPPGLVDGPHHARLRGPDPGRTGRLADPRRHQVSRRPRRHRAFPPHHVRSGAAFRGRRRRHGPRLRGTHATPAPLPRSLQRHPTRDSGQGYHPASALGARASPALPRRSRRSDGWLSQIGINALLHRNPHYRCVRGPGLPQSILAQHRAIAIPPPMPETLSGTWPPPTEVHSQTPIPRA